MLSVQKSFAESGSSPPAPVDILRITITPGSTDAIGRGLKRGERESSLAGHRRPPLAQVDRRAIDGELAR